MQSGKVSILMGVYNCAQTVAEAIDSILCQTYQNFELIVCDDGSTDDTFQIVLEYKEKYPDKIILLKNKNNIRLAATLNHCAQYATGEFIGRMDGDDISAPDRLEKEILYLQNHPEVALVGCYMKGFDEHGERSVIPVLAEPQKKDLPKLNPFHHATIIMRKTVFDSLGGYHVCKLTRRAEDVDLWFRFYAAGNLGHNLTEPLYFVREDDACFKRRTFKHSLEACGVLLRGIRLLKLPFWYYAFAAKPVISQLTPQWAKNAFRRSIHKDNQGD